MNRHQKELVVESLRESLIKNGSSFLIGYRGLSVAQMQSLKKDLRKEGAFLQVAKWRLMKKAAQGLVPSEALVPFFRDQVAIVFVPQDAGVVARTLSMFAKKNANLTLIAGMMEDMVLDSDTVKKLASLPPRNMLLGKLCGTLKATISNFVYILHALQQKLSAENE